MMDPSYSGCHVKDTYFPLGDRFGRDTISDPLWVVRSQQRISVTSLPTMAPSCPLRFWDHSICTMGPFVSIE